jgi:DNA-binding MarR family transcriptional regulator
MKKPTLSEKEKTALHWIHYMKYNYPKSLSEHMDISEKEAEKIIRDLEDKKFISVEEREGEIYGSQLTTKGLKFWEKFIGEDPLAEELGY